MMSMTTYRGHTIPAPGFDEATLARSIDRALAGGVTLRATERPNVYRASGSGGETYWTSRTGCSCPAGSNARPCKHRALVVLIEAITNEEVSP